MMIFNLFCSSDLDLDPITFVYELDLYSLELHRMCKYELPMSRLLKAIVCHTDIQTDTTEIIYHAACRVVKYTHTLPLSCSVLRAEQISTE